MGATWARRTGLRWACARSRRRSLQDPAKRAQEVSAYLRHPDVKVKRAAIDALGEAKSPSSAELLRPFLGDQDLPRWR